MICLDACILGHYIVPTQSRVPDEELVASARLSKQIIEGKLKAISPVVAISEVKWFYSRIIKQEKPDEVQNRIDEIEDLLTQILGPSFGYVGVDFAIATLAADFRVSYYSKKNPFPYNDGIYLATASITGCDALVTTDKHLLETKEVPVYTPSAFLAKNKTRPKSKNRDRLVDKRNT